MNIYRHTFTATCPNNGQVIAYSLVIEAEHVIMVEEIVEHCASTGDFGKPYHETIADFLHAKLGGLQRMTGYHHGVDIETIRGA